MISATRYTVEHRAERLTIKFLKPTAEPGDAPLAGGLAVMGYIEPFGTQNAGASPAVLLEDPDAFEQIAVADHERDPTRLIPKVDLAKFGTGVGPEPRNNQLPELVDALGGGCLSTDSILAQTRGQVATN